MWSLLAALHPAAHHAARVNHYAPYQDELKFANIEFPVSLEDISKVEELNVLAINVFRYDDGLHPVQMSKVQGVRPINLLVTHDGEKRHYCWIKNVDRLNRLGVHPTGSDDEYIEPYV